MIEYHADVFVLKSIKCLIYALQHISTNARRYRRHLIRVPWRKASNISINSFWIFSFTSILLLIYWFYSVIVIMWSKVVLLWLLLSFTPVIKDKNKQGPISMMPIRTCFWHTITINIACIPLVFFCFGFLSEAVFQLRFKYLTSFFWFWQFLRTWLQTTKMCAIESSSINAFVMKYKNKRSAFHSILIAERSGFLKPNSVHLNVVRSSIKTNNKAILWFIFSRCVVHSVIIDLVFCSGHEAKQPSEVQTNRHANFYYHYHIYNSNRVNERVCVCWRC